MATYLNLHCRQCNYIVQEHSIKKRLWLLILPLIRTGSVPFKASKSTSRPSLCAAKQIQVSFKLLQATTLVTRAGKIHSTDLHLSFSNTERGKKGANTCSVDIMVVISGFCTFSNPICTWL